MLEIIGIIALANYIGKIAKSKKRKPGWYQFMAVIFWILFEILGGMVGMVAMGEGWPMYVFAILGAAIGAVSSILIVKGLSIAESPEGDMLDSDIVG